MLQVPLLLSQHPAQDHRDTVKLVAHTTAWAGQASVDATAVTQTATAQPVTE